MHGLITRAGTLFCVLICSQQVGQNAAHSKLPLLSVTFLSVQFSRSVVSDSVTPWTAACQASLSITNFWTFVKKQCNRHQLVMILLILSQPFWSDFIKTSTGKETVNATFPVAIVMLRAIRDFFWKTGNKVGFKPAGGIRSAKDSLVWLSLIKEELGDEWMKPELFRIGASTLLADIERQHHLSGFEIAQLEFHHLH
ncbi:hypothetical protein FD755_001836 [Muntiacus reevesi]|uniref:deoxyribose-phosphate aldolase n=1 Tax=Muntiacus reevesi TaxID=9886 RepID=A0A5J5N849_MUNRE|nr:hypothetical protein FD755_001836 [Muntiacus reevesi]